MASSPNRSPSTRTDLVRAIEQVAGWSVSAVLPQAMDRQAVDTIATIWRKTKAREQEQVARRIQATLPDRLSHAQASALTEEWFRRRAELSWGRVRGMHRSGWPVTLEVEGLDHLVAARRQGKGAVIWYMSFCESFLLMRAIAEAGIPIGHLSRYNHGVPGRSRFGLAMVGPLYRLAEDRYLDARVVIQDTASPGYFKQLSRLLATNHAVTVRGDLANAGSSISAECLGVKCAFTAGAPRIAFQSGAPLLTAHASRLAPFHYRVVIGEEVTADRAQKRQFIEQAVAEYGRRLDEQLSENSPDWEGWWSIDRLVTSSTAGRES